jgi:hypothetical protein
MTSPNLHRPEGRLRLHGVEQRPRFLLEGGELNLEKQRVSIEQDHIDELGLDVGQSQALPLGSAASSSNASSSSFSSI